MADDSADIGKEHLLDTSEIFCRLSQLVRQPSLLHAIHRDIAVGGLVDGSSADT
jgi:hypothetical protein